MKKTKFLLAGIIAFFLYSCSDELDIPPPSEPISKDVFGISEAKRYFEDNANDLSFMHFEDHAPSTRFAKQQHLELTPDWSKAVRTTNHQASVIEVPILLNAMIISSVNQFEKGEKMRSRHYMSSVRLVIAQDKEGKTHMFVITLLPSLKYRNEEKEMENFRYLGGSNFTGKVFASTLDGRFVEASQYVNGQFVGLLNVTTRKKLEENNIDIKNDNFYESINFIPAVATRSGTYGFDENGSGNTDEGGSTGEGYCQYHSQYPASDCPYCLPEVVVRYCQICGARLEEGETCYCKCKKCGYYPCRCCRYCKMYPCTCMSTCEECRPYPCQKCTKCGRHFCFDSCGNPKDDENITPPPDPDIDPKPDNTPPNATNFKEKVLTEEFKSQIKSELGVDANEIPIIINSDLAHSKSANASYYNVENNINIFPFIFTQDWTLIDMTSILYHEFVHAKQYLIDGITLPRGDGNEIIMDIYIVNVSQYDIDQAWETLYDILDVNNIPRDATQRTDVQNGFYQSYKEITVDPVLKDYENGVKREILANKQMVQMELEAYIKEFAKYGNQISDKYRKELDKNIKKNMDLWNKIKNL